MEAKKLLEGIIADVEATKSAEANSIKTDDLLNYLRSIDTDSFEPRPEIELEGIKHNNQVNLELLKIQNAFQIEVFKSVISVGANACRAFMIMNGGAAIALLAFLGNIWNKSSTPDAAKAIGESLGIFCIGVLASGLCAGFTYVAQSLFSRSELSTKKTSLYWGYLVNALACLTGIGSLLAFGLGAYSAYEAMNAQLPHLLMCPNVAGH